MDASLIDIIMLSGILASALTIAFLAFILIRRYIKKLVEKTGTKLDDYVVNIIVGPIMIFILASGAIFALRYWDSKFPGTLPDFIVANLDSLNSAFIVLISTSILAFIVNNRP